MRILLSHWVQSLLGTALLAAVVWWFGPLLPMFEGWVPRVLAIQTMLVIWAVANALIDLRRRSRETTLTRGLLSAPGEEASAVGQTLTLALAELKKSGQRASMAELPWYAIIGPPGAGKTTALLNAGLEFTLPEQMGRAAIAGVGGTRLCEWWFTKGAVLIDTAGRYTTQDSDAAVDRAGWDAFLGLLKRTRPRQPLNGVIVAIALPEVVQGSAAERDAHAAAIARRIAELEQRLGVRMPVYALFTKADLLAGFTEFFDDLDREQRDQVWGDTFPLDPKPAPAGERFAESLRGLVSRLNERMLPRLQAEHRMDRRGLIAGFPTQVASLERPLATFLTAAFPSSTLLRGVYFASGTQEGTPIDRLTGAMARAFGVDQLPRPALRPEQGRSYFLGRLLRSVVFGEAMLVREPPGAARARAALRLAGLACVIVAVAAMAGLLFTTDQAAERQVASVEDQLTQYEQAAQAASLDPVSDGDLRQLAALLDQARTLGSALPATPVGFGMSQAAKLQAGANAVYRDGLVYGLLPRLVWRLETQMRGSLTRPDMLYRATRIYLMLCGAGPLNAPQVLDWMTHDWEQIYAGPDDAGLRSSLAGHLQQLLAQPLPAITLDGPLVTLARASFSRVPLADRVYASIQSSPAATALPAWRPSDILGLAGVQVFARASGKPMTEGIPGLYTAAGFRSVLLPSVSSATKAVASETWVIGRHEDFAPADLQDLEAAVTGRYFADFTRQWDAMLADLNIAPMTTLPQAAQALYILASPESPLRAVLRSMAAQVQLAPAGAPPASAVAQATQHYRGLIDLVAGDGATLERSLRLVADIQQQLAKIAALPVGTANPAGGEDIGNAVLADAARQPQPFARWLTSIGASAQALRTGNAKRQAAIAYNAPGGPAQACQAAVTNRYPFDPAGLPLPLDEFARVFGPGGVLDSFFNTQLKPFVDMAAKPWKAQPSGSTQPPLSAADVAQFQRVATIRDAFFPAGAAAPLVELEIVPAGPSQRAATLNVAGVAIDAGKGLPHATQLTWPAPDPAAVASLSVDPAAPPFPLTESGNWALFRLFARARLQPAAKPGRFTATFGSGAAAVAFEIRPGSQANPFAPGLFTDFHCPVIQ